MNQILQIIKHYSLLLSLVLMSNNGWGQISESFENGLPSSYNSSLNDAVLNSGTWQIKDVIAGTSGVQTGIKSAQIRSATAAQIITPTISGGVGTVSFYVTASSPSGAYQVNLSTDNGLTWNPATGSPFTIGTTKAFRTITINNSNVNRIQIYRTGATIYIDDFVSTSFVITNVPPTASTVSFSGATTIGQTLTGTYTYTDADNDAEGFSTFQWYRADNDTGLNSTAISGETNPTYMLQAADIGKYIRLGVVPVAQTGTSTGIEAFSSWQGPVTDPSAVIISVMEAIVPFANTCTNQSSSSQSYSVSASNLTEDITITAPTHFEISTDDAIWSTSIVLTPTSGTIAATTLYVRFTPTAVGAQSGNLNHVSAGATTQNITLNGVGINSSPTVTSPTNTSVTINSAELGGNITIVGCSDITIRGIEYSTTINFANGTGTQVIQNTGPFTTGVFTVNLTGLTSGTTYYYKAFATSAGGTTYTTQATFTTPAIAAPLALNASSVSATSFTATWNAVPGAISYEIDVYTIQAGTNATDLFISEYGEGAPGNRKYIEVFNGTGNNVDLSLYKLIRATNGGGFPSTGTSVIALTGTLSNGSTFTIANNVTETPGADLYNSNFTSWNGDDAIGLFKNDILIDVFGTPDFDPGSGWAIAGTNIATVDKIIVRKSTILVGNTNWSASAGTTLENSEWIVSRTWDASDSSTPLTLGNHTFNSTIKTYILQNQNVGNINSYPIIGLDQNTTYYFVVRALDATSVSINSNEIIATTTSVTTTWNGTTWSNGEPTSSVDAIIDGDFSSTADLVAKDVTINATRTLTINASNQLRVMGNLVNNGAILFKSDANSTGRFDTYTGNVITGSGTVTVERYIDGKRAYRLLSPGVTTSGSIANNWQQQVFITGSTTGANGFDTTTTGNPSMFTYEDSGWAPISNTNLLSLEAEKGYRVLIRGDRTPSLLTNPSEANMNTAVTLVAIGSLVTGDVTFTTLNSQNYTLVSNPYVSPIDWATVTKNNITPTYYVWDPNIGTVGQRGRYVSCDESGLTSIVSGGGSSSQVNVFIQPGQAFFIEKATPGVQGNIIVKETDKASTFSDVFRTNSTPNTTVIEGKLGMNLYESLAYSLGDYPIDGAVAVSGSTFNTTSADDDAIKLLSHGEQVAFVRENKQLGVEKVSPPQLNDVLTLATLNLVPNKNYVWSVVLQENFSNESSYLYDSFTQTYHLLSPSSNTIVSFSTTNDITSMQVNRFKIVFQNLILSAPNFTNKIVVYPNPAKAQNVVCYIQGISNATVTLHNILGQNIPIQTTITGKTYILQPTVDLNKGIYIVHIVQDGNVKQVKWIVD